MKVESLTGKYLPVRVANNLETIANLRDMIKITEINNF